MMHYYSVNRAFWEWGYNLPTVKHDILNESINI